MIDVAEATMYNHWILDSTPVECGRSRPTVQRSDAAGWAAYGYCAWQVVEAMLGHDAHLLPGDAKWPPEIPGLSLFVAANTIDDGRSNAIQGTPMGLY